MSLNLLTTYFLKIPALANKYTSAINSTFCDTEDLRYGPSTSWALLKRFVHGDIHRLFSMSYIAFDKILWDLPVT